MAPISPMLLKLSPENRQTLESWLVEFDLSWNEDQLTSRARSLPRDNPLRAAALAEMVKIDLERQWQRGRQPDLESYLRVYPELGSSDNVSADLIQVEYAVRRQFGASADMADFERRFPNQSAELRRLLEEASVSEVKARSTVEAQASGVTSASGAASTSAPLPEQFGRYRILQPLGQGGMGSVYLAHDSQLDRRIALKVPHFTSDEGPDRLERFHREARAAATLEHPNLCPVYDVGAIDGKPYLTMAYIEGQSLQQRIRCTPALSPVQAAELTYKIALALAEAHGHGVIHRDLKPSNVMLNKRGEPVIMDFGLARRVNHDDVRLTRSGSLMGTPAYMSPEQVSGDVGTMGPSCDIYALGVILYELLTGRVPFRGGLGEVMAMILTENPTPPRTLRQGIDPRLESICLKALAKKPAERFATMNEFADALADYLSEAATIPPALAAAKSSSLRGLTVAAGVVVVLLGLGGFYMIQSGKHLPKHSEGTTTLQLANQDKKGVPVEADPAKPLVRVAAKSVLNGESGITSVAFTGDGKQARSSDADHTVRLWDLATGKELEQERRTSRLLEQVTFSADGGRFVGTMMQAIELHDAETGKRILSLNSGGPHTGPKAFSANGRRVIISKTAVFGEPYALVWELETGKTFRFNDHKETIGCVTLSPDGKVALSAGKDGVRIWEVETGKELKRLDRATVVHAAFSPDGKQVVTGEVLGSLLLWDVATGKKLQHFDGHTKAITALFFTPDSRRLLSGSEDRSLRMWDVATGKEVQRFDGHTDTVTALALASDGRRLLSGSKDKTVRLWEVNSAKASDQ